MRLCRTNIEHLSWEDCINRYDRDHTLFYLDPPYWKTTGYGIEFDFSEYEIIADYAKSIKGKMIISVNDILEMRQVFDGLNLKSVDINYTIGGSGVKNKSKELIIKNW